MSDTTLSEPAVAALVDCFYARVREDALLGPVFNNAIGDHWPEHLATLTNFWTSVLLASGRYKGNPMMAHLAIPQMDHQHFSRWIELWRQTTTEVFGAEISAALVTKASSMGERLIEVSTRAREAQRTS
ncbi:MAG TPA: group III truncated hemoglobin [Acidobacteriaceae bacterium]|nr:group III truncated hemoglobin [Acidobacteriaceae bacterium]